VFFVIGSILAVVVSVLVVTRVGLRARPVLGMAYGALLVGAAVPLALLAEGSPPGRALGVAVVLLGLVVAAVSAVRSGADAPTRDLVR
jgi:hypothetical protein